MIDKPSASESATTNDAEAEPDRAKPRIRRTSPALARLNDHVVGALGTGPRDWLLSTRGLDALPPAPDTDAGLVDRTRRVIDHQALRRQANIECILYRALSELPVTVEDGTGDPDWGLRFFAAAADCGDPERQALWARLLVMEVTRPGAVPPVAFPVLASMSPPMLVWLREIAALSINNFVVRLPDAFFRDRGISSDVILLLEEYGLLRTNRDLSKVFRTQLKDRFSTNLLYADKILRVSHDDPGKELNLPCFRLTDAGGALVRALVEEGEVTSDTDYIVEIVKFVQKQGYAVAQADILARANENVVSKHSSFCEIVAFRRPGMAS